MRAPRRAFFCVRVPKAKFGHRGQYLHIIKFILSHNYKKKSFWYKNITFGKYFLWGPKPELLNIFTDEGWRGGLRSSCTTKG